jgi:hypothetical protein
MKLFDAYCDRIRQLYQSSDETKRIQIEQNLESLIRRLEVKPHSPFDPEVARRIRLEAGLSLKEVVNEIGIGKISIASISRFEREGMDWPSEKIPKKSYVRSYLGWLKAKGYNPYNLS